MRKTISEKKKDVLKDLEILQADVLFLSNMLPQLMDQVKRVETEADALAWEREWDEKVETLEMIRL